MSRSWERERVNVTTLPSKENAWTMYSFSTITNYIVSLPNSSIATITSRPHKGIGQRIPARFDEEQQPQSGRITSIPVLNGLHHSYTRVAI